MHSHRKTVFLTLFLAILTPVFLPAQSKSKITVDWIYSDAKDEMTAVPKFFWLENNNALLFDPRTAEAERTLELFDPASGKRSPAVDLQPALASLHRLIGVSDTTKILHWPSAFAPSGKWAAYLLKDDIFLLNLEKSQFSRVTKTEAHEKSMNFSPDGSKLAFVRDNNLWIYDIKEASEKQLTKDGSDTILNGTLSWVYWEEIFARRDIGYWWSGDSKAITFLQTDESEVPLMHFVDYKPVVPKVITQRYPKAGMTNPTVQVGIIEIGTEAPITWVSLPDYEYLARVKWLPGSNRFSVQTMNRAQSKLDLFLVDRKSGESTFVTSETDTGWVNINDDLYFLQDGKHFIWQSERDGYAHLYRFTLDGKLVNQITKGEWALRSSGGVYWLRQSVAAIDEKAGWVYFTALEKSSIERHLYRIKFDGANMQRLTKEEGTHQISFSPNAKYYFDEFSNITTPNSLALYSADGKLKQKIAEPRIDLLSKMEFQFPELFTIPTSDGFEMPAEILKPKDFDPNKKYPLIYYVYAGPSAPTVFNNWNTGLYFDQILADRGYLVVRFDHRAAAAVSKILENHLNKVMSGPVELSDVLDGVTWLKAQPYVDADRFGIWGWSGGGSFTLNAMTNSKEFKAGISVAPVTDWHYYDTRWAEAGMKTPQENPKGYDLTSFVKTAKNLHGRLLLVHGTHDDNVHPQNSWAFIEELIRANIPFDMMFYPMRQHSISDRPARKHLFTKMLEFWNLYL